jgi:hypothetical protein
MRIKEYVAAFSIFLAVLACAFILSLFLAIPILNIVSNDCLQKVETYSSAHQAECISNPQSSQCTQQKNYNRNLCEQNYREGYLGFVSSTLSFSGFLAGIAVLLVLERLFKKTFEIKFAIKFVGIVFFIYFCLVVISTLLIRPNVSDPMTEMFAPTLTMSLISTTQFITEAIMGAILFVGGFCTAKLLWSSYTKTVPTVNTK